MNSETRAPRDRRGWQVFAAALIETRLKEVGMTHRELSATLTLIDHAEPQAAVRSKLVRGTCSAAMLLEALHLLGLGSVDIPRTYDDELPGRDDGPQGRNAGEDR